MPLLSRREYLAKLSAFATWSLLFRLRMTSDQLLTRPISSTGEQLAAVGLGTWQTFDTSECSDELIPLKEVLTALVNNGGKVVDSFSHAWSFEKLNVIRNSLTALNEKR